MVPVYSLCLEIVRLEVIRRRISSFHRGVTLEGSYPNKACTSFKLHLMMEVITLTINQSYGILANALFIITVFMTENYD